MKTNAPLDIQTEREYRTRGVPYAYLRQYPELAKRLSDFCKDVTPLFLDMAQPTTLITDNGQNAQMVWFNPKRTKALIVHLGEEFHTDGHFRVTEELLRRHGMKLPEPEVNEKGDLSMQEIIPLALHLTSRYRPNIWSPTRFVKSIGPWELEMEVEGDARNGKMIAATLRKEGKIVRRGRHMTWESAAKSLHQGMGAVRREERNQARTAQYARNYLRMRKEMGHGVSAP